MTLYYIWDYTPTTWQASEVSKQSRSSRLTKQRSRSQSPEDMARSDNGCGDDDDDNIDVDDEWWWWWWWWGRKNTIKYPWEAPPTTIRFRLPHNCISPPIYPRNYPFQVRINVVELSRTQDGFRSTQMMNIADFRWTHHANTPTPATPTSMQRFLSPPPLKSCNKLTLVNRQTNNV